MHLTQESLQRFCKHESAATEFVHIDGIHIDRMRPEALLRCCHMVSLRLSHAALTVVEGRALAGRTAIRSREHPRRDAARRVSARRRPRHAL